jgi:hypothetical protein
MSSRRIAWESDLDRIQERFPLVTRHGLPASCGPGWWPIIERLCEKLELMAKDCESLYFTDIKEKWGLLRVSIGAGPEAAYDAIDEAEDESGGVCEDCGDPGTTKAVNGWYRTTCKECQVS